MHALILTVTGASLLLTACLIALRVNASIACSWYAVTAPLWLCAITWLAAIVWSARRAWRNASVARAEEAPSVVVVVGGDDDQEAGPSFALDGGGDDDGDDDQREDGRESNPARGVAPRGLVVDVRSIALDNQRRVDRSRVRAVLAWRLTLLFAAVVVPLALVPAALDDAPSDARRRHAWPASFATLWLACAACAVASIVDGARACCRARRVAEGRWPVRRAPSAFGEAVRFEGIAWWPAVVGVLLATVLIAARLDAAAGRDTAERLTWPVVLSPFWLTVAAWAVRLSLAVRRKRREPNLDTWWSTLACAACALLAVFSFLVLLNVALGPLAHARLSIAALMSPLIVAFAVATIAPYACVRRERQRWELEQRMAWTEPGAYRRV